MENETKKKRNRITNYETNINFRISIDLDEAISKYAKKSGIPKSKFIRNAIESAIEKEIAKEIKIEVEKDYC